MLISKAATLEMDFSRVPPAPWDVADVANVTLKDIEAIARPHGCGTWFRAQAFGVSSNAQCSWPERRVGGGSLRTEACCCFLPPRWSL